MEFAEVKESEMIIDKKPKTERRKIMITLRFTLNQTGLQLEQFRDGQWRSASVIFKPENHGGIANLKTKILYQITDCFEVMPPGEYREDGKTILCV